MTAWLRSSTGTVHVPESIDWTTSEAVAHCGHAGPPIEIDPEEIDDDDVCQRCVDAIEGTYGPIEIEHDDGNA